MADCSPEQEVAMERHGAAHRITATRKQDQSGHYQKTRAPTGAIDWSKEPKGLGEGAEDFDPVTGKVTKLGDWAGND